MYVRNILRWTETHFKFAGLIYYMMH